MSSLPPGSLEAALRAQSWCPTLAKDLVAILSGPHSLDAIANHQQASHWAKQSDWGLEMKTTCVSQFGASVDARTEHLRHLQSAPFCNDWLTDDGIHCPHLRALSGAEWQDLLKYRLGLTVMSSGTCEGCLDHRDALGDHALSCASCGRYARHNLLRDTLAEELSKAGYSYTLEEPRPADILVSSFIGGKPLAVDTTVCHPLRLSNDAASQSSGLGVQATSRGKNMLISAIRRPGFTPPLAPRPRVRPGVIFPR